MSKHTPGPWVVFINDAGDAHTGWPISIHPKDNNEKSIVRTGGMYPYEWDEYTSQAEAVANARLIAAAPDLLEALQEISAFMQGHELWVDGMIRYPGDKEITPSEIARAAIKKAIGDE